MPSTITSTKPVKRAEASNVIRKVIPYLWPEGRGDIKFRVVLSMLALLFAKIITVATPFFYKGAVDALAPDGGDQTTFMLTAGAVGLTVAYGVARLLAV